MRVSGCGDNRGDSIRLCNVSICDTKDIHVKGRGSIVSVVAASAFDTRQSLLEIHRVDLPSFVERHNRATHDLNTLIREHKLAIDDTDISDKGLQVSQQRGMDVNILKAEGQ